MAKPTALLRVVFELATSPFSLISSALMPPFTSVRRSVLSEMPDCMSKYSWARVLMWLLSFCNSVTENEAPPTNSAESKLRKSLSLICNHPLIFLSSISFSIVSVLLNAGTKV